MNIFKTITDITSEHASEILTAFGIIGGIGAVAVAIKQSRAANAHIDKAKEEKEKLGEEFTNVDALKACWKDYAGVVILITASTGCILGAKHIDSKKNAALTAALALSEATVRDFDVYKDKVAEKLGAEEEKKIAQETKEQRIVENNSTIHYYGKEKVKCFEPLTSRWFEVNPNKFKTGVNKLNAQMRDDMSINLNEFFSEIGLDTVDLGDDFGWDINRNGWLDADLESYMDENDFPCLKIKYNTKPEYI